MNTLPRYLRREIGIATLFVLFGLLAIFTFFDLLGELESVAGSRYTLRAAFISVGLSLPSRMYELMPLAALIGTIYALSKLASNSEFTIMRVSGMSTRRLAVWVLRTGLFIVAATYLLGEVVAPPAERFSQRLKLQASGRTVAQEFRSGVWARDVVKDDEGNVQRLRFVNVRMMQPDATALNWRVFEFDNQFRLRSMLVAERGRYEAPVGGHFPAWDLTNVVETRIPLIDRSATPEAAATQVVREPERRWTTELTPEIFGVLLVRPERMGMVALTQYIRHLAENNQRSDRYEIALWNKVIYPLAVLVMMALALPFAYLHVREGSVSLKIFSGVMLGVGFYMLNKLFGHLGLLNTWPPIVVAVLPSLVVLAVALTALYWIERR